LIYNANILSISDSLIKVQIPLHGVSNEFIVSEVAVPPGFDYTLKTGQQVLVGILNNDLSQPVLLGIRKGSSYSIDDMNIIANMHDLTVKTKALLPQDSYIGSESVQDKICTNAQINNLMSSFLVQLEKKLNGEK
jgi:hypothetical protein